MADQQTQPSQSAIQHSQQPSTHEGDALPASQRISQLMTNVGSDSQSPVDHQQNLNAEQSLRNILMNTLQSTFRSQRIEVKREQDEQGKEQQNGNGEQQKKEGKRTMSQKYQIEVKLCEGNYSSRKDNNIYGKELDRTHQHNQDKNSQSNTNLAEKGSEAQYFGESEQKMDIYRESGPIKRTVLRSDTQPSALVGQVSETSHINIRKVRPTQKRNGKQTKRKNKTSIKKTNKTNIKFSTQAKMDRKEGYSVDKKEDEWVDKKEEESIDKKQEEWVENKNKNSKRKWRLSEEEYEEKEYLGSKFKYAVVMDRHSRKSIKPIRVSSRLQSKERQHYQDGRRSSRKSAKKSSRKSAKKSTRKSAHIVSDEEDIDIDEILNIDYLRQHLDEVGVQMPILQNQFEALTQNDHQIARFLHDMDNLKNKKMKRTMPNLPKKQKPSQQHQQQQQSPIDLPEETMPMPISKAHPPQQIQQQQALQIQHEETRLRQNLSKYKIGLKTVISRVVDPNINNHGIYALLQLGKISEFQLGSKYAITPITNLEMANKRQIDGDYKKAKKLVGDQSHNIAFMQLNSQLIKIIEEQHKKRNRSIHQSFNRWWLGTKANFIKLIKFEVSDMNEDISNSRAMLIQE